MSVEAIETRNAVAIHSRACLKATSDGHRHAATIPPSSTAHRSLITRHFLLPLHRQSVSLPAIMQRRSYLPPSSPALPSCPPNPKGRRRGRTTQDRGWKIVDRGKVARHRRGRMRMERGRSDRNGTHCLTPVSTPASHPLRSPLPIQKSKINNHQSAISSSSTSHFPLGTSSGFPQGGTKEVAKTEVWRSTGPAKLAERRRMFSFPMALLSHT
jgi:hypothetical protein